MPEVRYRDIRNDLDINPVKGDILVYEDSQAIGNEIKNLIFTDRYERFWDPQKGAGIPQTLFENFGRDTEKLLETRITEVVNNFVKRANLLKVKISPDLDRNSYNCTIVYQPKNALEPTELDIILKRIR